MKQTLIKITDDHYVIVDDSEIKEGDWCLYKNKFGGEFLCQAYVYEGKLMFDDGSFNRSLGEGITPQKDECKLITHSTQPNKGMENVTFISPREVKELLGEVDLEKKITKKLEELPYTKHLDDGQYNDGQLVGFELGARWAYNQAIEDNKDKKYTEMDMKKAFYKGIDSWMQNPDALESIIYDFRQSLQPKTEWEVTFDEEGKLRLV